MNICLILPPRLILEGYVYPEAYPPLGLALIAACLVKAGHQVTVIDAVGEAPFESSKVELPFNSDKFPEGNQMMLLGLPFEDIIQRVPEQADIIAISCMFSFNWLSDRELVNKLYDKFPKATFIAGGESITGMGETCFEQCKHLNICILGEGEETIVQLADAIQNEQDIENVEGIIFKRNDKIYKTKRRSRIKGLEEIPFPAWELFPVHNYQKQKRSDESHDLEVALPIIATRGCPFICTFCTSPDMWGTRYYMRSPEHVIAEIEYLKEKFNATIIEFFDLTAIIKKEWIIAFAKLLIEKDLNIGWRIPAGTRSEAIDEEVAYYLKKSGCYHITYAPESGSPRLLKLIKKKVNLNNMLTSIRHSKKQGLVVTLNVIMGLPDEKHSDVWKTLWFLIKCARYGAESLPLHMFRPYPGSVLFDRVLKENKITTNNDDYLIDSLFTIASSHENTTGPSWKITYYNDHIGERWYEFYHSALPIIFTLAKYTLRPSNLILSINNILTNNYKNSFERGMANLVIKIKSNLTFPKNVFKHKRLNEYYWKVYTPFNIVKEVKLRLGIKHKV